MKEKEYIVRLWIIWFMVSIIDERLTFTFHDIAINIHNIVGQYLCIMHKYLVEMYCHINKMFSM